jgi:uncharacterized protein
VIWILWHRRLGDLNQMQCLAEALGLPFVVKKMNFKWPHYAPLARLDAGSDRLKAPWPDLILCAEALTSAVAQRLKQQSGGAIKIVCLARPSGDVRNFDLVLTTAQYRLPKFESVIELTLPLTALGSSLGAVQANTLVVLIGASSPPDMLNEKVAQKLIRDMQAYAAQRNLMLKVLTSPRTAVAVTLILSRALSAPHQIFVWSKTVDNPYQRILAEAAEIIVTSDSVSMLADAVVAGKPTSVYRLPQRLNFAQTCVEWLFKRSPEAWIFRSGLIEPTTDRALLIEKLIAAGHAHWFGEKTNAHVKFDGSADLDLAVCAIKRLSSLHSAHSL